MMDALWIITIGALVAVSCSLVGSFLVLRRMAMLGDAISHAVLPGIALAFLLTGSRNSWIMLVGAAALGIITAFLVQVLSRRGGVRSDAAIGVTFTTLFAIGVILISLYASKVDLDTDCVLYGVLEYTTLHTVLIGGQDYGPYAFWQMLIVCVLVLIFVVGLFKELKIVSFDPETATALGINAILVHYLLMGVVSVATVGAFEPVGAILVVAMLVVPPATAYLLTDDLKTMLWIGAGIGILSSIFGYLGAHWIDASAAGMMSVAAGFFFVLAFLFSPRHGVVTKRFAQRALSRTVVREDALQALWRISEVANQKTPVLDAVGLAAVMKLEVGSAKRVLQGLSRDHLLKKENGGFTLSERGQKIAQELVRRHRVYESYLGEVGYELDHVHDPADRVEHFLTDELTEELEVAAGNPVVDPHGKRIPPEL